MKKFLIIMQQNPYANSKALEGLEFALALSSFNQEVSLLFKGDGILQLLKEQESDQMVGKDFSKIYSNLPLFGINNVYIDQNSLREYDVNELLLQANSLDDKEIAALIKDHEVVLHV